MAAAKTMTVEVWVIVDDASEYEVGTSESDAIERYKENVAEEDSGTRGIRRVKLSVTVPLPETIELAVAVPAGDPAATAAV